MYWTITLLYLFVGTISAWKYLTWLWNKYDPFTLRALPTLRAFGTGHYFPGDYNYMDLKFSLARHAFMFMVTAAIMFWVKSSVIINIFTWGYSLYTCSAVTRYLNRRNLLNEVAKRENEKALAETLMKPLKDSKVVVTYSICANIVMWILYLIRP